MYAHFCGTLADKGPDYLVIDCGGVGYYLTVSGATIAAAPAVGEEIKCHACLLVREDALELYGFYSREEKNLFLKLKGVTGVGAKSAMSILSTLSVRDLSLAIVTGDAAAIARAPGVGKKTAQRLILELKDKVDDQELLSGGAPEAGAFALPQTDAASDAVEALIALGYQSSEAARMVGSISPLPEKTDEIIRMALKGMLK